MKKLKYIQLFETFSNLNENNEIRTIRDLAKIHPEMWDYYYKWRGTEEPELEKDLEEVITDYGYQFKGLSYDEIQELTSSYNDIKGYLNVEIEPISQH